MKKIYYLLFICLSVSSPSLGQKQLDAYNNPTNRETPVVNGISSEEFLDIKDELSISPLGNIIEVYEDKTGKVTIEKIIKGELEDIFTKSTQAIPNFQMTPNAAWCKFSLKNSLNDAIYLELGSAFLDSIYVYTINSDGSYAVAVGGDLYPYNYRDIKTNSFLFKLPLATGETKTFYVKTRCNEPLQFPINAGSMQAFYEYDHKEDFIQGMFYGIMILMILYNLMLFISTRLKTYLFYILYLSSITTFISFINGYFFEYLWPANEWINNLSALAPAATVVFAILFTRHFLGLKRNAPLFNKISWGLLILPAIVSILNFSGFYLQAIMASQVALLLSAVFFIVSSIVVLKKGFGPARFYMVAWTSVVASIVALILKDVNVLPYNIFTINALQIGSGVEVIFLSLAVADKINLLKKEKEEAQQLAITSLLEKETLIKEQNKVLEEKVQQRTAEIQEKNGILHQKNEEIIAQSEAIMEKNNELENTYQKIQVTLTNLQKEKETSESLLLNILPQEIAKELQLQGATKPKEYSQVSVLFTDFIGFTSISELLTTEQLVEELNFYFSVFEKITSDHRLEKIKTIGDSFMCAGGVPMANSSNAFDAVKAALAIKDFMENDARERAKTGKHVWQLRIGINTGPVIATVVGKMKFAYDIWGDTVNVASRMETNSEPGKINISESTYQLIKDDFECSPRGSISVKNKGQVNMYFVEKMLVKVSV